MDAFASLVKHVVFADGPTTEGYTYERPDANAAFPLPHLLIFVKTLEGRTHTFDVEPAYTVNTLIAMVAEKLGEDVEQVRLIFGGKQLERGNTLEDHRVEREATIHFVKRLSGGMYHKTSGRDGGFGALGKKK